MRVKRRGDKQLLKGLTKGGGGVGEMLTMAVKEGEGGLGKSRQWLTKRGGGESGPPIFG